MSAIRRQDQDARPEQARRSREERKARLEAERADMMVDILRPWESASSSVGPLGASTAEPASSSDLTREESGALIPQTPQRTPRCFICERKANEHSICAFCKRVCCDRHRRNTVCCQYWKCPQCSCYCNKPPPVFSYEESVRGPQGAVPMETPQPKRSIPERLKKAVEESRIDLERSVPATPITHVVRKLPDTANAAAPKWALKETKEESAEKLDDQDDGRSTPTVADTPVQERTPSPLPDTDLTPIANGGNPQEEEEKPPQKAKATSPPQPEVLTYTSLEDMKENFDGG